jgi:hypothetical protein
LWQAYTPEPTTPEDFALARAVCERALENEIGSIFDLVNPRFQDVAHFAASTLGYLVWGNPDTVDMYGIGDLGGWALDLLSMWGVYEKLGDGADLGQWMSSRIGGFDIVDNAFDYADLVADADAWLISTEPGQLSTKMRVGLAVSSRERIAQFYEVRFNGSDSNVIAAFLHLIDGLDWGPFDNVPFTKEVFLKAARASRLPTVDEGTVMASAFSAVLANPPSHS